MTAPTYEKLTAPKQGSRVTVDANGDWKFPDDPIVCLMRGDGIGRDVGAAPGITTCAAKVIDAAVAKVYKGKRKINWFDVHAGDVAREMYYPQVKDEQVGTLSEEEQRQLYLPDDTLKAFANITASASKATLTTPIGGGFRSINVFLRIRFDLYACVRPVKYFKGVEAPNKRADKVDMVIFRENTEDVYCGIEFRSNSDKAKRVIALLTEMGYKVPASAGIGVKPMSPEGSKRLIRMAIKYAIEKKLPSVTLMHKGNIMKFTEGAFKDWGYELAKQEFRSEVVSEDEAGKGMDSKGKVLIKDRIADSMFQQIQLRPDEYSVIATPNLNGDYLSDAAAAMTGGIGLAAGANIGDKAAMFEATHGTAPKYTGKNLANPGAVLLSGVMLSRTSEVGRSRQAGQQGAGSDLRRERAVGRQGTGAEAFRHLRHRSPIRRLRRRSRGQQLGVCRPDYCTS